MVALVACGGAGSGATPTVIRFDAAGQGQMCAYTGSEPRLVIAADAAARADLERVTQRAMTGDVLVAVFHGQRPTGGFSVSVESIRLEGGAVVVTAAFVRPAPDAFVIQVFTSPFAVVNVSRADLPSGTVRFLLRDTSGAELARAEMQNP